MKYLRWVGVVSSLVIGGLIVAPVQSEASGTSIQIQSGPNSVGGAAVVYNTLETIPITASSAPPRPIHAASLSGLGSRPG